MTECSFMKKTKSCIKVLRIIDLREKELNIMLKKK